MGERVEWIRGRLDELEAAAKAAPSELNHGEWPFWVDVDDQGDYEATNAYRDRFRPAQMLARVAADRAILAMHQAVVEDFTHVDETVRDHARREVLEDVIQMMAEGLGRKDCGSE